MSRQTSRAFERENAEFMVLLEKFPLEKWLLKHGFTRAGRGQEFLQDCPWCGGEEKLSVNPTKRKGRCLRCVHGFNLLELVAEFEGSLAAAVEVVRLSFGGRSLALIPDNDPTTIQIVRPHGWQPDPIEPPAYFTSLTHHHQYTARRNLNLENLQRLGVGVCSWGTYQDRLVFPVRDFAGRWIYFQSRATWEKSEHGEGRGKYRKNLNPANQDPTRFASASDVLMGLELARGYPRIAIVEGPTDLVQSLPAAVATLGKNISDHQIRLLVAIGVKEVDLCYDPDAYVSERPGRQPPAEHAAERLSPHFLVRLVRYPDGDPGSRSVEENMAFRGRATPLQASSRLAEIR